MEPETTRKESAIKTGTYKNAKAAAEKEVEKVERTRREFLEAAKEHPEDLIS